MVPHPEAGLEHLRDQNPNRNKGMTLLLLEILGSPLSLENLMGFEHRKGLEGKLSKKYQFKTVFCFLHENQLVILLESIGTTKQWDGR